MTCYQDINADSVVSTLQTAITFLTDSIRRNMDAGHLTGTIFVDLRKAFDTIDHKILFDAAAVVWDLW